MLDRGDARRRGELDGFGSMRVRRDFASELGRLVDDGFHFFERVLRGVDRVALGEHAARCADLDDVRAVLDLIAHGFAPFLRAVRDAIAIVAVFGMQLEPVLIAVGRQ